MSYKLRPNGTLSPSVLVAVTVFAPASAQQQSFDFNIPAQSLAASLRAFARAAGQQVVFDEASVHGKTARALRGTFGTRDALTRLLAGSGLAATWGRSGIIIIRPAAHPVAEGKSRDMVTDDALPAIVVTGSRIDEAGLKAPTPVLSLDRLDAPLSTRPNITAALNEIPQFRGSGSTLTAGNNSQGPQFPVDLRGLGPARTLVLFNGRRFKTDTDLNSVPAIVIDHVDIVTGGASAAWGAGAVAGVVNLTTYSKYHGITLGVQRGISKYGDNASRRYEGLAGTSFAQGRGQALVGGEYLDNKGVLSKVDRENVGLWAQFPNPAYTPTNGQSQFILAPNVRFANAGAGGVITTGVLTGQTFDSDGTMRPFQYGTVSGSSMMGGEGFSYDIQSALSTPVQRYGIYGKVSYELTDSIALSADVRHARSYNNVLMYADVARGNIKIGIDNAFLPAAARAAMLAAGQTSFLLGRSNTDFNARTKYDRRNMQETISLDGKLGRDLAWNAYYSHGSTVEDVTASGYRITANFDQSVDSVIDPATGQPACRVALTKPSTTCVPINLFGLGAPSQAALNYVAGSPSLHRNATLDVGGTSIRGKLFDLGAGAVSFATGVEARREHANVTVDPISAVQGFTIVNFYPLAGGFSVKEGFGEVLVPLVHNTPLLQNLALNGAARVSHYSNTGTIWSWKVGMTDEITKGVRIRVARSRDVRSPNTSELFASRTAGFAPISDPVTRTSDDVRTFGGGNRNLQPETSKTWTAGVVMQPNFLPGLSLSLDCFRVLIDNVITSFFPQDVVTRCANGNQAFCTLVSRGPQAPWCPSAAV